MPAPSMVREYRTALVVEDEPLVMELLTNVLARYGYNALTATDGDQGRALFRQHAGELSLLVVNIALPKSTGLEFIDNLPTRAPRIPVVFITGLGEYQQQVRQVLDRGFPVLQKPFTTENFMDFIRSAASNQQTAAGENPAAPPGRVE